MQANALVLKPLQTYSPEIKAELETIYTEAFPPEERRAWSEILQNIRGLRACAIELNSVAVGIITLWELGELGVFVEHFALAPTLRGQGIGGKVLNLIKHNYPQQRLILEAEPQAFSPTAGRRLAFYARHGLLPQPFGYNQPPYQSGGAYIPLLLLSNQPMDAEGFERIRAYLYQEVYQVGS